MRKVLIPIIAILVLFSLPTAAQERPAPLPLPDNGTRGVNSITNGDFETDSDWTENSLSFPGDLICNIACGNGGETAGPNTGTGFVWLGGGSMDASALSQSISGVVSDPGKANLVSFYLWNGTTTRGFDRFYAKYASHTLFEIREGTAPYATAYAQAFVNITGLGDSLLTFSSTSMDGAITNFSLDDVVFHPNLDDLITDGSFEIDPLQGWTVANKTNDKVICTVSTVFGNCVFEFKGSTSESAVLSQPLAISTPIPAGSALVGSFWAQPVPGGLLKATLTVKYGGGLKRKVKLSANFNPLNDDSDSNTSFALWKQYQLPMLGLTGNAISGSITFAHSSTSSATKLQIDQVSVAVVPSVLRLPMP